MDLYWRFCDPVIVPEAFFSAWGSSLPIQSYHPSVGSSRSSWNSFVPTLFLTIPQTLLIPYSSGFLALVIIHLLSSSQSGRSVPTDQSQVSSFLHLNLHSQQQTTTKKNPKQTTGSPSLFPILGDVPEATVTSKQTLDKEQWPKRASHSDISQLALANEIQLVPSVHFN